MLGNVDRTFVACSCSSWIVSDVACRSELQDDEQQRDPRKYPREKLETPFEDIMSDKMVMSLSRKRNQYELEHKGELPPA